MNIAREEDITDDLNLSCTWADIVKTPRIKGKRDGVTLLSPAADKEGVAKKKRGHKDYGSVILDPNKIYIDSAAT